MIHLSEAKRVLQPGDFLKKPLASCILLEGIFESNFRNRMLNELKVEGSHLPLEESKPSKMIVIADGDIIRNNVRQSANGIQILPLGFDRYSNQTYGNKEFLMNAINYLTDDKGLIELRNREVKLRLLNKSKIREEKLKWQLINTLFPFLIICLAAVTLGLLRKRRHRKL